MFKVAVMRVQIILLYRFVSLIISLEMDWC